MQDAVSKIAAVSIKLGKAGIDLLESFAIPEESRKERLAALKEYLGAEELIYIATCNRVEFIMVKRQGANDPATSRNRILDFFFTGGQIPRPDFEPGNFRLYSGREAARHIFRVAASLDSIVIGEAQILGQVKAAHQFAQENKLSGAILDRLFAAAYKAAKLIRTETELGQRPVSIASLVSLRLDEILNDIPKAAIAIVGSGPMTPKMAEIIRKKHTNQLLFVNRTREKVERLAEIYGGRAISLDDFIDGVAGADIIISSTASQRPIFTSDALKKIAVNKIKLYAFDLAIPRDFSPELEGDRRYEIWNLEKLNALSQKNRRERFKIADQAHRLLETQLTRYLQKEVAQLITPCFDSAVNESLAMAEEGLAHLFEGKLSHLSEGDREILLYWSRKVISRACYLPARHLAERIVNSDIDPDNKESFTDSRLSVSPIC
jgi:glutamyl-tRNA reductase